MPDEPRPPTVSAAIPDWAREAGSPGDHDPGRHLLAAIRTYQRYREGRGLVARVNRAWAVVSHRFWSSVCASDIPLETAIEGGLLLPHPLGIVIHPQSRIGPNCLIFHQVTLGLGGQKPGAPTLGGHVDVGAGAKILGGVTVGDHAKIGANAVVLDDVPAHAVAVGIPARIVSTKAW